MDLSRLWTIVLAGGDGTRVRELAVDASGTPLPKQYWSLDGGPSLLRATIDRLRPLTCDERIVTIVAASHRRWWREQLADMPPRNVVVQASNRGTAAGVLLPLLHVLERDPDATVVITPSDHWVERGDLLRLAVGRAVAAIDETPGRVVLLTVAPTSRDHDYGWVVPRRGSGATPKGVRTFVEKPDAERCNALRRRGGQINSMIVVARGRALRNLFYLATPHLLWDLVAHRTGRGIGDYDAVPKLDFSRDVLTPLADRLSMMPIPPCGWTDVGTPYRVARVLEERTRRRAREAPGVVSRLSVREVAHGESTVR